MLFNVFHRAFALLTVVYIDDEAFWISKRWREIRKPQPRVYLPKDTL